MPLETVLRLEELLFPSITDVAVLSVDVNSAAIRVEARRTTTGEANAGSGLRFPLRQLLRSSVWPERPAWRWEARQWPGRSRMWPGCPG